MNANPTSLGANQSQSDPDCTSAAATPGFLPDLVSSPRGHMGLARRHYKGLAAVTHNENCCHARHRRSGQSSKPYNSTLLTLNEQALPPVSAFALAPGGGGWRLMS